ncbi:MAG: hypothetical protein EBS86_06455, partial [Crocinitomicaceae bacterium]|nr:hypothetical protein [Crocinitomicaceae bacterium]
MIKNKVANLLLFLFITSCFYAQNSISGIVYDDLSNKPLENVKIKIVGTNTGAISDVAGKFTIATINFNFP